jgi:hypothetical protein
MTTDNRAVNTRDIHMKRRTPGLLRTSLVTFILVMLLFQGWSRPASGFSCPADERAGVRVQACQVGDDIQVLAHNANDYSIDVDTRTTYVDQAGSHVKSSSGRIAPNNGGQIDLIQVRPYHALKEVTDISIKDIAKR